ncbi:DUF483 domain-containing protein [Candidatus Methanoliparum sp. LAM-1]|uniref:DUF483 domain-containing protein n=1 Tax=Candidatus Methanoliparum sp. LAM-1 TaxID=2874846 RepID=UPI001E51C8D2|nr:DUF483 domain-containing protein [Candidatus Methanoliparum sp. LAM-1]BDC35327.1 hypothetical protein MTLP_00090 [Candidatus Methanoliparum sp. LAM-1]
MKKYIIEPEDILFWIEGVVPIISELRNASLIGYPIYPKDADLAIKRAKRRCIDYKIDKPLEIETIDHQAVCKLAENELNKGLLGKVLKDEEVEFRILLRTGFLSKVGVKFIISYDLFLIRNDMSESIYNIEESYEELLVDGLSYTSKEWKYINGELFYPSKGSIISTAERIDRMMGEILSYPSCCVNRFIENKKNDLYPLEVMYGNQVSTDEDLSLFLKDIITRGKDFLTDICKKNIPDSIYSTPYMGFYPCSINCRNAIKLGKKLKDFSRSFGLIYPYNFKCLIPSLWHYCIIYGNKKDKKVIKMKEFLSDRERLRKFAYRLYKEESK